MTSKAWSQYIHPGLSPSQQSIVLGPEAKTGTLQAAPLRPPPMPLLGEGLVMTSQSVGNAGGLMRLYGAVTGAGPWTLVAELPLESPYDWHTTALADSLQGPASNAAYRVTEVGNGGAYVGESAPSVVGYVSPM